MRQEHASGRLWSGFKSVDELEDEEEEIRRRAAALAPDLRRAYHRRMDRAHKDPDTYAALNWFFVAGLHHFYLRAYGRGVLDLALFLGGAALLAAGSPAGLALLAAVFVIELPALFRAQAVCRAHNNRRACEILGELEGR